MSAWMVEIGQTAEQDVIRAAQYVRDELDQPQAAQSFVDELERRMGELASFPLSRPRVRDARLAVEGYRWMPVGNHMMFFAVDEAQRKVYVERVLFGRADWRAQL